ncbi:hypothetical protein D9M68_975750 [compost metagenome]
MRSSKVSALEKITPSAMRLRTICWIGSMGCTLRKSGVMTRWKAVLRNASVMPVTRLVPKP